MHTNIYDYMFILNKEELIIAIDNKDNLETWINQRNEWMSVEGISKNLLIRMLESGLYFRKKPEQITNVKIYSEYIGDKIEYIIKNFELTDQYNIFENNLKTLNEMGQQGWEICVGSMTKNNMIQYLFKRKIK